LSSALPTVPANGLPIALPLPLPLPDGAGTQVLVYGPGDVLAPFPVALLCVGVHTSGVPELANAGPPSAPRHNPAPRTTATVPLRIFKMFSLNPFPLR